MVISLSRAILIVVGVGETVDISRDTNPCLRRRWVPPIVVVVGEMRKVTALQRLLYCNRWVHGLLEVVPVGSTATITSSNVSPQ